MASDVHNLLAGRWVEGPTSEAVLDPYTGETLAEVPLASAAQVEEAIGKAEASQDTTRSLATWERAEILRNVAAGIEARALDLARTISAEAGKPLAFAQSEVARAVETFGFAADELRTWRDESLPLDAAPGGVGRWGITRRFPVGPVAAITPFNFPLNLVAHKLAPALATGCPVVHKPANATPLTALALGEIVLEAGWPPEALSVLNMAVSEAGPLSADPRLKLLSFTGSAQVGWQLKARAAHMRVLLELGGDGAVIVEPDVRDWDAMIARVAHGAFAYAGQVCISVQRVLVHRDIAERFEADLVAHVRSKIRVGAPSDEGVISSAMIDDRAADRVMATIADALDRGARCVLGGQRDGRVIQPCVLAHVPGDSLLGSEEVFGPVVTLSAYDDFEEALDRVNESKYGLQAGVFTSDLGRATRAFARLEVGAVVIGDVPTFRVDHMPYGGIKASGFGREGLKDTIGAYTEPRLLILPGGGG